LKVKVNSSSGFTLLEVMLAMAILAIALVAVFQLQSQSISMVCQARFATTASLLAQSKMAEVATMDQGEINADSGDFGGDFPDYSWKVDLTETQVENAKKIEVTVTNERMTTNNSHRLVLYRYIKE
jgi:general secretion pathway protein I